MGKSFFRRSNSGFTLVETMIGSAVLVTVVGAMVWMRVGLSRSASDVGMRRDAYRIVDQIFNDLVKDDRYIIPRLDPEVNYRDSNHPRTWFFDNTKSVVRCLDIHGEDLYLVRTPSEDPPATGVMFSDEDPEKGRDPSKNTKCPYMVSYFKIGIRDHVQAVRGRSLASDTAKDDLKEYSQIPVSRYQLRIRFRARAAQPDKPVDPGADFEIMEVSRLVTNVLPF